MSSSSTLPLNSSHECYYRNASHVSRTRYALAFTPLLQFFSISTEGVRSRTGEYVFDFAVVVFGVRVSIPASFLSRAVASWTLCSRSLLTAFQLFRAETLGGLRDVATRTHARVEHVLIAPFASLYICCRLTSDCHSTILPALIFM